MQGLLLAVGRQKLIEMLTRAAGKSYEIVGNVKNNDSIEAAIQRNNPDILLIMEGLEATKNIDTIELIIGLTEKFPKLRIIFLAGEVEDNDTYGINRLGTLVEHGVYDIYHRKQITTKTLLNLLDNPRSKQDVEYLLRYKNRRGDTNFEFDEPDDNRVSEGYENIFIFTSIKPGSGKSFVSTNVGTAIARWGKRKPNGSFPSVAIVEGDLQTLSVGTLLQLDDKERNLKNALHMVSTVIADDGTVIGTEAQIEQVKHYVRSCFLKCYQVDNLYVLVGSQLTLSELSDINPYQYYFMLQLIADQFDVIIVDTNSSLEHKTTGPLLDLARKCYYILDLDYNNIANNIRYRNELNKLGVMSKVRYILNKDIPEYMESKFAEKLEYTSKNLNTSGFELTAKIPMVDTTVVYNRAKQGKPMVLDKTKTTLEARKELFAIADDVYPIDIFNDLREEIEMYKNEDATSSGGKKPKVSKKKKEKKGFGFFRKKK